MSEAPEILLKTIHIPWLELDITVNVVTLTITWIIIFFILVLAFLIRRRIRKFPGRLTTAFELLYEGFENMAREALGEDARKFTPLIFTLFIFVLLCNWIGVIPGLKSPTSDLNTCLGLGLMVFVISHTSAILHKGVKKYLLGYTKPFFFFLPLNIVGELGKVLSHSFRLFGNMFAGGVIFALTGPVIIETATILFNRLFNITGVFTYIASAPGILFAYFISQLFFGLFVGFVQALVFALLALTYIAVLRET